MDRLDPAELTAGSPPPTPPYDDPLNDIYGSEPCSPLLQTSKPLTHDVPFTRPHEILSDLPSRQRAIQTDAYREGLSTSKSQFIQEGFDEGYSLGANLGVQVGYILGVLHGFLAALSSRDNEAYGEVKELYEGAKREFAIEELLGQKWMSEEGVWMWGVQGEEEGVVLRDVAEQHPVVRKWRVRLEVEAERWGLDLRAVEKIHAAKDGQDS